MYMNKPGKLTYLIVIVIILNICDSLRNTLLLYNIILIKIINFRKYYERKYTFRVFIQQL